MRRTANFALALLLLALAAACDSDDGSGGMPKDLCEARGSGWPGDAVRLNHIQMKGTHNSYHLKSDNPIPDWQYEHAPLDVQLEEQGVRQFELDIHWEESSQGFGLYHVRGLDDNSNCGTTLAGCLAVVRDWSAANPEHHTIFIYIEPKEEINDSPITGHWDTFDAEVRSVFAPEQLVTPDDVTCGEGSLQGALANHGWPTVEATRGRILFMLLGPDAHAIEYAQGGTGLEGRVMFVEAPEDSLPYASVRKINNPVGGAAEIRAAVEAGLIVRTMTGSPEAVSAALAAGAHMLSTDYPIAGMHEDGFWVEIPGGTPSRCNPVTALQGCSPEMIEELP